MLEVTGLHKSFGALTVTDNVSFRMDRGERRVVLGPNGAGKTTLFNLLAGDLAPSAGEIRLDGRPVTGLSVDRRARLGLSRSYQKNNLFDALTVRENLALAAAAALGLSGLFRRDTHRDPAVVDRVAEIAGQVGLADRLDLPVHSAPYGNRRQLEVGIALAARPKVLLMDEPTSGVGPGMIHAFHELLGGLPRDLTILIIEHDMDLAFDVADRITVLNYGKVVFEGTPEETRASPLVHEIYLGEWGAHA
ncbi:ABC transporter ATP-binding protein [Kaustia mangrovi]|uniref:ABC transporter ATP-binding protein n=1 Tax=Kaustia mangrovi TaxID=2593653 RepID=A0A7S8C4B8_9HYPH|nr:ABC transporter ATP-binding protein [Kaustia mangrovi]QPC43113.1 ABC transporter ATP-binding protein [Kaustia mangrovi]